VINKTLQNIHITQGYTLSILRFLSRMARKLLACLQFFFRGSKTRPPEKVLRKIHCLF